MINQLKVLFLIVAKVSTQALPGIPLARQPVGRGEGLDCDIDQLVEEVECSLAQGFNVSFFFQSFMKRDILISVETRYNAG